MKQSSNGKDLNSPPEGSSRSGQRNKLHRRGREKDPEDDWNLPKKVENPLFGLIRVGALLVAVGAGFVWFFGFSGNQKVDAESNKASKDNSTNDHLDFKVSNYLKSTPGPEILESSFLAVQGFMNASTPEERCLYILGGESRLPQMLKYESRLNSRSPRGLGKVINQIPNTAETIPYWNVFTEDKDGQFFEFIMIPTVEGMKIDWACSFIYSEISLQDFTEKKPEKPVKMRIVVKEDPLRNVDDISNYLIVKNGGPIAEFSVYFSDEHSKLKDIVKLMKGTLEERTLQVEMFWNTKTNFAEISKMNQLWWFDYEMIEQEAPELLSDRD